MPPAGIGIGLIIKTPSHDDRIVDNEMAVHLATHLFSPFLNHFFDCATI
jgi:hypothetical protein